MKRHQYCLLALVGQVGHSQNWLRGGGRERRGGLYRRLSLVNTD